MERFAVQLDDADAQWVKATADHNGLSWSQVIAMWVRHSRIAGLNLEVTRAQTKEDA